MVIFIGAVHQEKASRSQQVVRAHLFKASISLVHRTEKSLRTGTAEAATELDTMPRLSDPPWLVASAALTNAMSKPKCCIRVSSTYAAVQDTS